MTLSLRTRVLLGALLWSLGLFLGSGLFLTHYMLFNPSAPGIFHGFFYHYMFPIFGATIVSLVVGLAFVRQGLASFDALRARLLGVREGRDSQLHGDYPIEVQPLVVDLNALLADREQRIARAHRKAGDLAHGLKTPLTLLTQHADKAKADGHAELSASITQQVDRMRRQIEYHLAHARASAAGGSPAARCHVVTSADALARTMNAIHAARGLTIDIDVPHEHFVKVQREDFEEMLGNLLDNACKWSRSVVRVSATATDAGLHILVDDDGPGLPESLRETVLQRGVRADEAAPGSGLGLAIVSDLAELYGGAIALDTAPLGGLRARLTLPPA